MGVNPGMGTTWLLPRLVGIEKTSDLLLTGRKVSGSEAAQMGLVLRAVLPAQLMDEARELAAEIAEGSSPTAVSVVKRMTWGAYAGRGRIVSSHL